MRRRSQRRFTARSVISKRYTKHSMEQTCTECSTKFEITNGDLKFYDKISPVFNSKKYTIPPPTTCPNCRQKRLLAFRNEQKLYKSNCGLCKEQMISAFAPDSPYTVYCNDCFWSDKWNPMKYGRDYDFDRTFFEQFEELFLQVPKASVLQLNNENCKYNHLLAFSKNTYMSPGSFSMENCIYVRKGQYCRDCVNSNSLNKCELVSDSSNCDGCYSSHYLRNCRNCSFSQFLQDCSSLTNCFLCCGLQNKKYCIKNKQYSEEEYKQKVAEYLKKSQSELIDELQEFNSNIPRKAFIQLNCDNSSGDYLYNCSNADHCFDCFNVEDGKYLIECEGVKDCMDMVLHDKDIELCYQMTSGGEKNYQTAFCFCTIASPHSKYLYSCFYLRNGFGCEGIHSQSQYCILNKQYTQEEYEKLMPRIIEHMKETGEWGEFFPVALSPFAYNETVAQEYFPMTKKEVLAKGWKWRDQIDEAPDVEKTIPAEKLPALIKDIPDDILNWAIECEETKKPFKILKQELAFYRKMNLPIPHFHPDERHKRRMASRNPRKLWKRECGKCGLEIETTYAPEKPEKVYCEKCYLKEVY
jgi:hypothetical protein